MAKERSRGLPGESVFLEEIQVPQGLLIILIVALFVFITRNDYFKLLLYGLTAYFIFIWILVTVRDQIDKAKKPPQNLY